MTFVKVFDEKYGIRRRSWRIHQRFSRISKGDVMIFKDLERNFKDLSGFLRDPLKFHEILNGISKDSQEFLSIK